MRGGRPILSEGVVNNRGVRICYLDSDLKAASPLVPIVFIPGMLNSAEYHTKEIDGLAPRRCIAISLRGRGKSDSPAKGYSFDDHVGDIEAVVDEVGLESFCLMGYSVGVAYAIGYAARHPRLVRALVLGDFPAEYHAFSQEWVDYVLENYPGLTKPHAARGMKEDSTDILLWDSLGVLDCPVLVLRGGKIGSLLSPEAVEMYKRSSKNVEIIAFGDAGHELWEPDMNRYLRTVKSFLERIDSEKPRAL